MTFQPQGLTKRAKRGNFVPYGLKGDRVEPSIETQGASPYEIGALVVGILQDRYMARIQGYDASFDNRISVNATLPNDPRIRRIVLNRAQADKNMIFLERSKRVVALAARSCDETRGLLRRMRETAGLP